jgi:GT2 family glycosyltransferase
MIETEIIIPTYNQDEFTINCFDSILKHTENYRLVWVDNSSTDKSRREVMPAFMRHSYRMPIWNEGNLGFVGGVNHALEMILDVYESKAKYIVIMNNDTLVTDGWLTRMQKVMERDPMIAAAGPITSTDGSWQGWKNAFKAINARSMNISQFGHDERGNELNNRFKDYYKEVSMVAFFCTVFKREAIDKVGRLDERFGAGLGDDDDYTHRLRNAGYKIAFVPSSYVAHFHRTTFKSLYSEEEIKAMQTRNLNLYKAKHGVT